ncbi:MAG: HipA domain-containing protein [Janthinobacterium lividum]
MSPPSKNPSRRSRGARHPNPLDVWAGGRLAGQWTVREGEHRLQYAQAFAASPDRCALSLSLPFAADNAALRGPAVENWFDNLLPTGAGRRQRLQRRFGTASTDAFDLLSVVGIECAGTVQVLLPGTTPDDSTRTDSEPLTDAEVEQAIDASLSTTRASGQGDAVLLGALGGTQEKIALRRHGDRWFRPSQAAPTTHILKRPSEAASAENEWLCSRVMAAFGFDTAACDIATFGRHKVLVIERFDRAAIDAGSGTERIARLPQEDCCQALGRPVAQKYETDGGPGMREILRVLDSSIDAPGDRTTFVKAQMVFWLLAATDVHAKNLSIFPAPGGGCRLAPFYGVNSAWPGTDAGRRSKLAMALRSKSAHWQLSDLSPRHWDGVARLAGLGDARSLCEELAAQVPGVLARIESLLPAGFPEDVARPILDGIRTTAARLHDAREA